jgi:hypothetical protein
MLASVGEGDAPSVMALNIVKSAAPNELRKDLIPLHRFSF